MRKRQHITQKERQEELERLDELERLEIMADLANEAQNFHRMKKRLKTQITAEEAYSYHIPSEWEQRDRRKEDFYP